MHRIFTTFFFLIFLSLLTTENYANADDSFDDLFKMPEVTENRSNSTQSATLSSDSLNSAVSKSTKTENSKHTLPFSGICSYEDNYKIKCSIKLDDVAYIYRDSLQVNTDKVKAVISYVPEGVDHTDLNGTTKIIDSSFEVEITLIKALKGDSLSLLYRGCDSAGICYPEQKTNFVIDRDIENNKVSLLNNVNSENYLTSDNTSELGSSDNAGKLNSKFDGATALNSDKSSNTQDQHSLFKTSDNFLLILFLCLIFGAALDLTPCVLPMLSVYSATILGGRFINTYHAFKQNLSYLSGLALTYCVLGLVFAQAGVAAHSVLQHPLSLIIMASLLLIFAFDCMGAIHLKVPSCFNAKLEQAIGRQKNGTLKKAFVFGALSALIATPCTSAPLAGALIYVISTNSIVKGMLMFLFIGIGMGVPLLVIGTFGSRYINFFKGKGNVVKNLLAIPLIIGSYFIVRHLFGSLDEYISPLVYALCTAYAVGILLHSRKLSLILVSSVTTFFVIFSLLFFIADHEKKLPFETIQSYEELSSYKGQNILVTVSADWCSNCHELDRKIYSTDEFKKIGSKVKLVRFDFTQADSKNNLELAKKLSIVGVPFVALLDKNGNIKGSYTGEVTLSELQMLINE